METFLIILFSVGSFTSNFLWRKQRFLLQTGNINVTKAGAFIWVAGILAIISIIGLVKILGWKFGLLDLFVMFGLAVIFQK
ncbi:MAG: hypothetical protein ACD_11C00028G0009 [uncultured bacterium]|nr:MAG: hypothetical protein ACD_11C00028G0009 [uncultured bacterium]HBR71605.1 hypothetical protein [Candidatus Moranbacteria bacterium]